MCLFNFVAAIWLTTFYSTMDNGFLLFNHVKIPHVNMLAKYSSVDPKTNKYVKPAAASLVYGTLTWVRSTIVLQSGSVLARGVTIATRYAAIRRQFQDRDAREWGTGESQVLNYVGWYVTLNVGLGSMISRLWSRYGCCRYWLLHLRSTSQGVG